MLSFIIFIILTVLTFGLGGVLPEILPPCAMAAMLCLFLARQPNLPAARKLWVLGVVFFAWIWLTALPLPAQLSFLVGPQRNEAFARVDQFNQQISSLSLATSHEPITATTLIPGKPRMAESPPSLQERHPKGQTSPTPRRFSLNTTGTLRFILLGVLAWCMFWLTANQSPPQRRRLLKGLVVGGTAVAMVGIANKFGIFPENSLMSWQPTEEYGNSNSIWPFINRNHFAFFAAVLTPAALCLTVFPNLDLSEKPESAKLPRAWLLLEQLGYLTCFLALVEAVYLSHSRGGTLAMGAGLFATVLYLIWGQRPLAATMGVGLIVAAVLLLVFLPDSAFQLRLETLRDPLAAGAPRFGPWFDSFNLWQNYPVCGVGMDAVRVTLQSYRSVAETSSAQYLENEYCQFLSDGGLIGCLFLLAFLTLYAKILFPSRPRKDDVQKVPFSCPRPLVASVLGAIVIVLLHSLVDFPLRIPLNASLTTVLFGLALPVLESNPARTSSIRIDLFWRFSLIACGVCLLGITLYAAGKLGSPMRQHDQERALRTADLSTLKLALAWAPTYWSTWHELGRRAQDHAAQLKATLPPVSAAAPSPALEPEKPLEITLPPDTTNRTETNPLFPLPANQGTQPLQRGVPAVDASVSDLFQVRESTLANIHKWEELALYCFRNAKDYNPSDYRTWWNLTLAEYASGNLTAAAVDAEQTIRLNPSLKPEAEKLFSLPPAPK